MQMLEIWSKFFQHFLNKTLGILHHVNVVNFVPRLNDVQKVAGKGNDYKMWLVVTYYTTNTIFILLCIYLLISVMASLTSSEGP